MELSVGQIYGEKYRIVRLLGQGSMGAVYEGENVRIRRKVAIKTLHANVAEKGDTLQRFEREAQAAGRIGSKHICEVLDMGDLPDGSRYMVMEHLEGVTLQQHIRSSGRLKPLEASAILQQLLEGLGGAHTAGIIHRDLKPANVFLVRLPGRPDFVKILDFGVSKFSVLSDEMSMTRTGAVLGTPYYMSPEQAKGARGTDARSDLYAVGVILYECITGQVPFSAETFNELLFRIVLESPPPAESFVPDLPPELAAIIRKSMAREPAERYQTADELKQALAAFSAKAEAEGASQFDGLATLDAQTVMRTTPFAMPGLRPAPPSTTAAGMMVASGGPAPQPAVSALGTVIIDPDLVPAGSGAPGAPPAPAHPGANGAAHDVRQSVPRVSLPTAPLPQWPGPAAPNDAGMYAGQAAPGPYGAPPPGYAGGLDPYGAPITMTEQSPRPVHPLSRRPMRAVAFLGITTGLLLGIAAWALLWRHDDVDPAHEEAGVTTAAAQQAPPSVQTAAPVASGQPAGPSSADPAPPGASDPAPAASPAVTLAATDPASGVKASTKATAGPTAKASSSPTATAAAAPAATDTPVAKPGGTNPSGKRTVSQDL
jgi:hypothetical protein